MIRFKEFIELLIESRVETLKKKFSKVNTDHDHLAYYREGSNIVQHFADNADPTPKKIYTQWIMNRYNEKNFRQEDHPRIHQTLSDFEKHKPKIEKRDINSYKSLKDLEDTIQPFSVQKSKREEVRDIKHEGAEKIHDENGVEVHHLKNKEAACHYGAGTRWCTAAKNNNMFDMYNRGGKLYFVKAKDEKGNLRKYQFHHESDSYMDENDEDVDLRKLVKNNPELKNVREFQGKHPQLTNDKEFDKHVNKFFIYKEHDIMNDNRVKPEHISKALNDEDVDVRHQAIQHPNVTPEHISKALNDEDVDVRKQAIQHPNVTPEHISKALDDKNLFVRKQAIQHPNATPEHISKALNDKSDMVRRYAEKLKLKK